jgi:hypothetical protein
MPLRKVFNNLNKVSLESKDSGYVLKESFLKKDSYQMSNRESIPTNQLIKPQKLTVKSPDFMDSKYNNVVSFQYNTNNKDQFQQGRTFSKPGNVPIGRMSFNPQNTFQPKLQNIEECSVHSPERDLRRESVYYHHTAQETHNIDKTPVGKAPRTDRTSNVLSNLRLSKNTSDLYSVANSNVNLNLNQESLINQHHKELFLKCLSNIVETETRLEETRKELVCQEDFSIDSLFSMIDLSFTGSINFD